MKWVYRLATALVLTFSRPAIAQQLSERIEGQVTDPAQRLSEDEREELEEKLADLRDTWHADLVVFLVADLQGEMLERVAWKAYWAWHVGRDWESGALIVVGPDQRMYITTTFDPPYASTLREHIVSKLFPDTRARTSLAMGLEVAIDALAAPAKLFWQNKSGMRSMPKRPPAGRYRGLFVGGALGLTALALLLELRRRRRARPDAAPEDRATSALLDAVHALTGWPKTRPAWFDVLALTGAAFALRTCLLSKPAEPIFDESFYLQAARVILGRPVDTDHLPDMVYSGLDPNQQHPPLAKLLFALSIHLLGDNPLGQRLPSVLFGTAAVPLLYALACQLGARHGVALCAAYLFALDNLVFVHSRTAMLDIFLLFFMLCALYLYVRERTEFAALALTLATVCKLPGLFGWAALLGFEAWSYALSRREPGALSASLRRIAVFTAFYVAGFLLVLGALDASFTTFAQPLDHLRHMIAFGAKLTRDLQQDIESAPWQWLVNEKQIPYVLMQEDRGAFKNTLIEFRAAFNPYLVFLAPMALAYAGARAGKNGDRLCALALALFAASYLPYWVLSLGYSRVCYLYYLLPGVPGLALATAALIDSIETRAVRYAYVGAVAFGAWTYFPFHTLTLP